MKLRIRAFGLALGVCAGLVLFVATLASVWFGRGQTIYLLSVVLPGYKPTILGSFVGLFWGAVEGFLLGALHAWLYNMFHMVLYKSGASK